MTHTYPVPEDFQFHRAMLVVALLCGAALGALFLSHPQIDLDFSAAIREICGGDKRHSGWCHENGIMIIPRYAAILLSTLFVGAAIYGLARSLRHASDGVRGNPVRSLVLLASFAIGPGLLANVVLKDHWGRARPREVVEFGGKLRFSPPLVPSNECRDNCSFVSGEAASVYTPFFAGALLVPQFRAVFLAGGVLAGTAAGLVRISTGGHFLSDVLFAGVFMAITTVLISAFFANGHGSIRRARDVRRLLHLAQAHWGPALNFTTKVREHP